MLTFNLSVTSETREELKRSMKDCILKCALFIFYLPLRFRKHCIIAKWKYFNGGGSQYCRSQKKSWKKRILPCIVNSINLCTLRTPKVEFMNELGRISWSFKVDYKINRRFKSKIVGTGPIGMIMSGFVASGEKECSFQFKEILDSTSHSFWWESPSIQLGQLSQPNEN